MCQLTECSQPSAADQRASYRVTANRLKLINEIAVYDEATRAITYPDKHAIDHRADDLRAQVVAAVATQHPETEHMAVYSFDIDLTLEMPEDTPGCRGVIPVQRLQQLQHQGAIVGTCSDREPSDQRLSMQALGFSPDFCIPKEMLDHTARLLPATSLIHVGDDELRDRKIALQSGWTHLWPSEF